MINSIDDIKNFINDKSFKRIFVLCGKKSFISSGATTLSKDINLNQEIKLFYKKSEIPILEELIEIIKEMRSYSVKYYSRIFI